MTSSIRYEFASRIRSLTCRSRFASPPFATREELRLTWRCWTARDRFTLPNLRWRAHGATNFAAWSNCIGHWGEGGDSDLVETSSLAQMSWARGLQSSSGYLI